MGKLGLTEILLIVLAIFLLFGATRLPKLAEAIGDSIKVLKKSVSDSKTEKEEADKTK